MGHLVNATSTRLGWTNKWSYTWYSNDLYYCEYLYAFLRIRYYLIYLYFRREVEKIGHFFSHFDIINSCKGIFVYIYYYDAILETDFDDYLYRYIDDVKYVSKKNRFKYFYERNVTYYRVYIILSLLKLMSNFKLKTWPKKWLSKAFYCFTKFGFSWLKKLFNSHRFFHEDRHQYNKLLVFYYATRRLLNNLTKNLENSYEFINDIFFYYHIEVCLKPVHEYISKILAYIFSFFFKNNKNIYVSFFLVSNMQVNASFLSRFIAKKLNQNLTIRFVLNPIKKEFIRIMYSSISYLSPYINKHIYKYSKYTNNLKNNWKYLLSLLIKGHDKYLLNYYLNNSTWFSINTIILYSYLNINHNKFPNITKNYYKKKSLFLHLFFNDIKVLKNEFNNTLLENSGIFNYKLGFSSNIYKLIFNDLYLGIFFFFNLRNTKLFDIKIIKSINKNFNNFLSYNYWMNNYSRWLKDKPINSLRDRNNFNTLNIWYKGFKVQCAGRFSRRQRARSYWFSIGKVPLNTWSEKIDYGYYSLPIRNSLITVKVWINEGDSKLWVNNIHAKIN